ncbi:hypothetical protein [EBPR siphovirus 5]|nr:hypothetical protein [EBPR siphovirus 5]
MNSAFPLPAQLPVAASENMFLYFRDRGYATTIPILPPDAHMVPYYDKDGKLRQPNLKARGKSPGIRMPDGTWRMMKGWTTIQPTREDCIKWHRDGASVGLRADPGFQLLDVDSLDPTTVAMVDERVVHHMGKLPRRIGRAPKSGYVFRTPEKLVVEKIYFGSNGELIEIIGNRLQFVAWGPHQVTKLPYSWPDGIPHFEDLPMIETEQVHALFADLMAILPQASHQIAKAPGEDVDPKLLRGDPEWLRKAVEALPNRDVDFPSREDWLRVGMAIKAGFGPEHEREACELFVAWTEKWDSPSAEFDEDEVRVNFERMQPTRIGASWLYETATRLSEGSFVESERWFDPPAAEPLFPPEEGTREALLAAGADPDTVDEYRLLSIGDLLAMPDPKFLIDRHVPERGTGILYGAPGTGKSFITLDATLALAFGFETWQGNPINLNVVGEAGAEREKVCVVYLAGEGAPGYKPRIMAWMQKHGIPLSEWERGRFALIDDSVNFMNPDDVSKLVRSVKRRTGCRVAVLVVDTASRVLPGADENLQKDMSLFIDACRRLERALECVVWGVHHTNKSGDMRGSSVIEGGADFIFALDRPKGSPVGSLFCFKMKDGAADAWTEKYRFDLVSIEGTANPQGLPLTSLTVERCTASESGELGGLTPEKVDAVFEAIRAAAEAGEPWSLKHNVKGGERFYQKRMLNDFKIERSTSEAAMQTWLAEGRIRDGISSAKTKKKGLYVPHKHGENLDTEPVKTSVFD